MRILVLGGTRFLGRAFVESALVRGHEPTLFNRGRTSPELFPEVEQVRGDREDSLDALAGREWDAVVDVASWLPRVTHISVDALRDAVRRYVYVSSISVYEPFSEPPVEGNAVAETDSTEETEANYGAFKAQCERIVLDAFGDRALVVRPGLIVGPHDPTGRFTYWPRRVAEGGEVLAPGAADDPVQFIDVRDLAEWMVRLVEDGVAGVYNATGEPLAFGDFLQQARDALASDATFTWIPSEKLLDAGVGPWTELPLWLPPNLRNLQQASVARAREAGLTYRPLEDTVRDTLAHAASVDGVGLAREKERELLAGV